IAESSCLPKLSKVAAHFLHSDLLQTEEDRTKLHAGLEATRRLLNSIWVDLLAVLFAYLVITALSVTWTTDELPLWNVVIDDGAHTAHYSAAGRWHEFVSLPLLIVILLGWVWRQFVWWKLLW